jgi:osmotically-inducible protein OsmY
MNCYRIEGGWTRLDGRGPLAPRPGGPAMPGRALPGLAAAGLAIALALTAATGCATTASPRTSETAGEFVDNSVITTKVKAAFLNEPRLKSFQISVKTYKDVVQLSGFVDSSQAAHLAGKLAGEVHGVASVRNDLIVK